MFLGLLDERGHEIDGRGYVRKDLSAINFKISPPQKDGELFIVLNQTPFEYVSAGGWKPIRGWAFFQDPLPPSELFFANKFDDIKLITFGDSLKISPGDLKFSTVHLNDNDPPPWEPIYPINKSGLFKRFLEKVHG